MPTLPLLAVVVAFALAGCGNDSPSAPAPKVGEASGTSVTAQSGVPAAAPDRDTPPASTPATHAGTPQPDAPPAPTARDTAANQPLADLTKPKENASLPLAGQVNNHSTTATDRPNKTTPDDGAAAPAK